MHQWTIQMKLSQVDKSINLSLSLNWTNWTLTVHLPWVARGMIQSLLWCRWRRKCKLLGCSTSCLFCFLVLLFSRFSIGDTGWCFFCLQEKDDIIFWVSRTHLCRSYALVQSESLLASLSGNYSHPATSQEWILFFYRDIQRVFATFCGKALTIKVQTLWMAL